MWTTFGDSTGFHVLVAEARSGYLWRTAATLSHAGVDTDQWIGNACVTGSGQRAVVVYAPRTLTNRERLANRGGFTAIVDLTTGAVTNLPLRTSLAYFNPGCGADETAALTQEGDQDLGRTRVVTVDAASGRLGKPIEVPGQLTSAVPTKAGLVAADKDALVRVADNGARRVLAVTRGVPFHLVPDGAGGVVFIDRTDSGDGQVRRVEPVGTVNRPATTLATGRLDQIGLRGAAGKVFITGQATATGTLTGPVTMLPAPVDAAVSTHAEAAVISASPAGPAKVNITAQSLKSSKRLDFTADPANTLTPSTPPAERAQTTVAPATISDTTDPNRSCAVPRNDPFTQVYQPLPKQVEWAADMAVKNHLRITRPANWKSNGLDSYIPQEMFPPEPLKNSDNGQVPAQVLLGILGQESNLWQASNHVLPGETGNPLIGNFYGNDIYNNNPDDDWDTDFAKADCGYGVSQMTDGMRLPGHPKPNEPEQPSKPWNQQKAIATDYAANVAAGLQLLIRKWNELQDAGVRMNNNDPSKIENWFGAVWAYNSGYHQPGEAGSNGAYGLGWGNNPANPRYRQNRAMFGEDPHDFAHPQDWPYPEKVLGFAAHPPSALEAPGKDVPMFRAAWWNSIPERNTAVPRPEKFCTAANQCEYGQLHTPNAPEVIGEPAGPCAHTNTSGQYDLKCWWHEPADWKLNCEYSCGNEFIRYDYPEYANEPADGGSYPPVCTKDGLPPNAWVIDDVSSDVPSVRDPGCTRPTNSGSFSMTFGTDSQNREASKIDLHQVGGGFGAHFWFSHTNFYDTLGQRLKITGTWTLFQPLHGWARVLVHMPDHGAQTRQARYDVDLGNGSSRFRVVQQRLQANHWVSIGAFPFDGTPQIRLSNQSGDGGGVEDVAWDAVAVQMLPGKPQIVAALGDSYASGEGASLPGGVDYYRETDVDGNGGEWRDACHRSRNSWSRQMRLPDSTAMVGARADAFDPYLEYRMVACSGAEVMNVLPYDGSADGWGRAAEPRFHEVPQLASGFIDQDTTLVTMSIGGNDARFSPILQKCIEVDQCQNYKLDGDPELLKDYEPKVISNQVRTSVELAVRKIHEKAPQAKILLMGYPLLFGGYGNCIVGIDDREANWLNSLGEKMREQMSIAAQNVAGEGILVKFADPVDAFKGKALCDNPEYINEYVFDMTPGDSDDRPVSQQSFHPNLSGATAYSNVATEVVRQFG